MTETLNQIKDLYEAANPDVTLVFNFDSSGTLKTQIQEGADCDVFISAAPKQMSFRRKSGLFVPTWMQRMMISISMMITTTQPI